MKRSAVFKRPKKMPSKAWHQLLLLAKKDEVAWATFVEESTPRLTVYFSNKFHYDFDLVKEAIQRVFVTYWKKLDALAPKAFQYPPHTYLRVCVAREITREIFKEQNRRFESISDKDDNHGSGPIGGPVSGDFDELSDVDLHARWSRQDSNWFKKIAKMAALTDREEVVVREFYLEGTPIKVIGERLGMPISKVYPIRRRALEKLRRVGSEG